MSENECGEKKKVDSECRVFKEDGQQNTNSPISDKKAVCLICQESIAVFKDYNLSRHFQASIRIMVSTCHLQKRQQGFKLATI